MLEPQLCTGSARGQLRPGPIVPVPPLTFPRDRTRPSAAPGDMRRGPSPPVPVSPSEMASPMCGRLHDLPSSGTKPPPTSSKKSNAGETPSPESNPRCRTRAPSMPRRRTANMSSKPSSSWRRRRDGRPSTRRRGVWPGWLPWPGRGLITPDRDATRPWRPVPWVTECSNAYRSPRPPPPAQMV